MPLQLTKLNKNRSRYSRESRERRAHAYVSTTERVLDSSKPMLRRCSKLPCPGLSSWIAYMTGIFLVCSGLPYTGASPAAFHESQSEIMQPRQSTTDKCYNGVASTATWPSKATPVTCGQGGEGNSTRRNFYHSATHGSESSGTRQNDPDTKFCVQVLL